MSKVEWERECGEHCRSLQHGSEVCSAVTLRGLADETLAAYLWWLCCSCGQVTDSWGRTALHIAASCGHRDLARWLLCHAGASINIRDLESGYTPLHRSIFYGQLHVASLFIQLGASINAMDYDDLTPLDHAMKDHLGYADLNAFNPCEVYVWGNNNNYTLGTGNQRNRAVPELLEVFRKQDVSIKQVAMHKYHTVFVTHGGSVFSCGHGQRGRLGQGSEQSVLVPQPVKFPDTREREVCIEAAVGRDHTVLLMENGSVWTCGLNAHHQLGHVPPPSYLLSPRELPARFCRLPGSSILQGVCAARFHTVLWGSSGILTCGLHAGQLGHIKSSEGTIIQPRLVSVINKDCYITAVAASDGATVVATRKGDVYVLHEYQCQKIPLKQAQLAQIAVVGGHLDAHVNRDVLIDRGGEELKVAALNMSGSVLVWQESAPQVARCVYMMNRSLIVSHFAMNHSQLLVVTKDGEAFEGEIKPRKGKKILFDSNRSPNLSLHDNLEREHSEYVKVKRLPHIHRAVRIASDPKGRNFAAVQVHPKASLLEVPLVTFTDIKDHFRNLLQNAHPEDLIHDVIFEVGSRIFAAHHFIVASCSETLSQMIKQEKMSCQDNKIPYIKISHIYPEIFEQVLQFVYTLDCDILTVGPCRVRIAEVETKENGTYILDEKGGNINEIDEETSPSQKFPFYDEDKRKKRYKNSQRSNVTEGGKRINPVKLTQEAAKKLNIPSLHKMLDKVRFEEGFIIARDHEIKPLKLSMNYNKHQDLYDVTIRSEDGKQLQAHKCVLAARLQYFSSMFSHGWLESSSSNTLSLPVNYSVLEVLIHFLYEDESPAVSTSEDIDFICNVIALADQLFVTRLMEICEVALANLITLRNVTSLLQIADTYQAKQLKLCCMQYICLNLSAILESRTLEIASETVLEDLSKYYRDLNPAVNGRVITPYSNAPDGVTLKAIIEAHPFSFPSEDDFDVIDVGMKKILKQNKKKFRLRRVSDNTKSNERLRNESVSSNASNNSDEGDFKGVNLNLESLAENYVLKDQENKQSSLSESLSARFSPWVKITSNKQQKILKARLKAISFSQEICELSDKELSFTKLIPESSSALSEECQFPKHSEASYTMHAVDTSPKQDLKICESDFPELQRTQSHHNHHSAKLSGRSSELKKIAKLSQKQLKKQLDDVSNRKVEAVPVKKAWINTEKKNSLPSSLVDIMKEEYCQNKLCSDSFEVHQQEFIRSEQVSPHEQESNVGSNPWTKVHVGSPSSPKFRDILADEKKQRDNWTKMRTKPLELTQLEDRAIEDLLIFYNAAESSDERISVHRVITDVVATPVWITSHTH